MSYLTYFRLTNSCCSDQSLTQPAEQRVEGQRSKVSPESEFSLPLSRRKGALAGKVF
jgi:hypothetical protein